MSSLEAHLGGPPKARGRPPSSCLISFESSRGSTDALELRARAAPHGSRCWLRPRARDDGVRPCADGAGIDVLVAPLDLLPPRRGHRPCGRECRSSDVGPWKSLGVTLAIPATYRTRQLSQPGQIAPRQPGHQLMGRLQRQVGPDADHVGVAGRSPYPLMVACTWRIPADVGRPWNWPRPGRRRCGVDPPRDPAPPSRSDSSVTRTSPMIRTSSIGQRPAVGVAQDDRSGADPLGAARGRRERVVAVRLAAHRRNKLAVVSLRVPGRATKPTESPIVSGFSTESVAPRTSVTWSSPALACRRWSPLASPP